MEEQDAITLYKKKGGASFMIILWQLPLAPNSFFFLKLVFFFFFSLPNLSFHSMLHFHLLLI